MCYIQYACCRYIHAESLLFSFGKTEYMASRKKMCVWLCSTALPIRLLFVFYLTVVSSLGNHSDRNIAFNPCHYRLQLLVSRLARSPIIECKQHSNSLSLSFSLSYIIALWNVDCRPLINVVSFDIFRNFVKEPVNITTCSYNVVPCDDFWYDHLDRAQQKYFA